VRIDVSRLEELALPMRAIIAACYILVLVAALLWITRAAPPFVASAVVGMVVGWAQYPSG